MVVAIKSLVFRLLFKFGKYAKPIVTKVLPFEARQKLKKRILKSAFPIKGQDDKKELLSSAKGINLIGYARAEMGIGESCRIAAKSANAASVPFGIINFTGTNSARKMDTTWSHKEINSAVYDINVFHINAEQMTEIYANYGNSLFLNRYNIGYWHWELPDFPDEWLDSFSLVDEIWVPSTFVADSIALKSPVPVVKIPHSIEVQIEQSRNREHYGLPMDSFLFLTMYDIKSYQERKNPKASIKAFKKAFKPDNKEVGLVIKVNSYNSDLTELNVLYELIGEYQNIYMVKDTLSRNDVNALISNIDCYVSLHRSEGFGLGLAEAMYLGKPVIGTNWSSNTDFMNNDNSCPVRFDLVQVGQDHGPYKAYQYWADPDLDHASEYMEKLVYDVEYYNRIASKGEEDIKEHFSPKSVGALIQKRLDYIYMWKFGGTK
ncbi:glycosyltransferase family 1 protein [Paenibacillus sambharensis]|uniref:Glycosyltransferase family 1 protein n=1 Tax=Paenibacillus sambharensis TaxID=1803190 RepID=A0A2W1LY86_9BACL|nr:glycosyltransferase family 4 protein [Paenibacillus sambharensis]PZD96477.1 glycosyltransferase family 1 protein [Paenibacillus sambharensis]